MFKYKKCPKCRGHILLESDMYGSYEQCLQCGYLTDVEQTLHICKDDVGENNSKELVTAK